VFDVIVRKSRVYDEAGNPWMEADLGIAGWKLVESAASTPPREALVKFWGTQEQVERIVRAEAP
jgi:N-acyl-D-aspartate/D-glutamate deacylase